MQFECNIDFPPPNCGRRIICYGPRMSRSKHQTLKSVIDGQSKEQIDAMFAERDHDAMEWMAKGAIKRNALRDRREGKRVSTDIDEHSNARTKDTSD